MSRHLRPFVLYGLVFLATVATAQTGDAAWLPYTSLPTGERTVYTSFPVEIVAPGDSEILTAARIR